MKRISDSLSLYEPHLQNEAVSVVSIPLELGSDARGLAKAPAYLIEHGLLRMLASLGIQTTEEIGISCPEASMAAGVGRAKNLEEIAEVSQRAHTSVLSRSEYGDLVVAIGGDHSISVGTISGASLAHENLGIIWIDAHPDANTPETTLSGNVHGMPAAVLMGFGDPLLTEVGSSEPKIKPENFLYLGLKDLDPAEIEFIRRERVAAIPMFDIASHGLAPALAAIDDLKKRTTSIWVSMDMDSIDAQYAPGVAMTNEGGLTKREVLALAQYIGNTCTVAGLDVVEMLPAKDKEGMTAALALELISNFLGGSASWYQGYMQNYEEANRIAEVDKKAR